MKGVAARCRRFGTAVSKKLRVYGGNLNRLPSLHGDRNGLSNAPDLWKSVTSAAVCAEAHRSLLPAGVLYEITAVSRHVRRARRLRGKPHGAFDAVLRAAESFGNANRNDTRCRKPLHHWSARSKLSAGDNSAERIQFRWLCACRDRLRGKSRYAISGERKLTCCVAIRRSVLSALAQIGSSAPGCVPVLVEIPVMSLIMRLTPRRIS